MKKTTTHFQTQQQFYITYQDAFRILILLAICLLFCLKPTHGFGQPTVGSIAGNDFPVFDTTMESTFAPQPAAVTPTALTPVPVAAPVSPVVEQFYAPATPEMPVPVAASASPVTANQFSPAPAQQQPVQPRTPQRGVVVDADHPFRQYSGVPNDPQAKITGKPVTVAELFAGTRSSAVRNQLLQAYWELSGQLAVYHFRCETEKLASGVAGQQPDMLTLLREQRRTAEMEFIKQQWVLAELLKQYKGRTLRESELPIPIDYPLFPKYQTHASKIARTERTQYLGRMIPIQEQLIETKHGAWKAASEMVPNVSQPFFVISSQRATAFLDLTRAIVDYNKMIAEYAMETIPPNVSPHQLVGAVVRLPKGNAAQMQLPSFQTTFQTATDGIRLTQYEVPAGVTAQPIRQVSDEYLSAPLPPSLPTSEVSDSEEPTSVPTNPLSLMSL